MLSPDGVKLAVAVVAALAVTIGVFATSARGWIGSDQDGAKGSALFISIALLALIVQVAVVPTPAIAASVRMAAASLMLPRLHLGASAHPRRREAFEGEKTPAAPGAPAAPAGPGAAAKAAPTQGGPAAPAPAPQAPGVALGSAQEGGDLVKAAEAVEAAQAARLVQAKQASADAVRRLAASERPDVSGDAIAAATSPTSGQATAASPASGQTIASAPMSASGGASGAPSSSGSGSDRPPLPSGGLVVHVTSFDLASYSGKASSGKTWHNIAVPSALGAGAGDSCSGGELGGEDFQFRSTPSYSPSSGFSMAGNPLTGPMCHMLGIDANLPFTIAFVFQPTGDLPAQEEVELLMLSANTAGMTGLRVALKAPLAPAPGVAQPASASASTALTTTLSVRLGSADAVSAAVTVDKQRRYLLVVSRDSGGAAASVVDLDAATYARTNVLSGAGGGGASGPESIKLSNMDSLVNGGGKWNASLSALMIYARSLSDLELGALYTYYADAYNRFDPAFIQMQGVKAAAAALRACPYDVTTCAACAGVKDWSGGSDAVLAAGGEACGRAIDRFCTANPTHPRCTCWDPNAATYTTASCRAFRGAFSGQAEADAAALRTWRARATQAQAQAQSCPDGPAATPSPAAVVTEILSPSNVSAITSLLDAIRGGPSDLHRHHGGADEECKHHGHHGHHHEGKQCKAGGHHDKHKNKHEHEHEHGDGDEHGGDRGQLPLSRSIYDDDSGEKRSWWSKLW